MGCSEARLAANRRNALRSSGPRTEAGKQASRGNALKHGLSGGDGVVLTVGDGAAVDALAAELAAEMGPVGAIGDDLVRRAAVLVVRLRRCAEHDHAATAHRVRHAAADFDDDRADEVAALADRIDDDPAEAVRRLRRTPEGVDRLLGRWRAIRAEVAGSRPLDDAAPPLADRVGALLGLAPGDDREPGEMELDRWCRTPDAEPATRGRILARVDGEVAALRTLRREVAEITVADRAEAPARALFDPTPAGHRARRYEAAAERGLFRVLREIREARADAAKAGSTPKATPAPVSASVPTPPVPRVAPAAPAPPPVPVRSLVWSTWLDGDDEFDVDVPLAIGRGTIHAQTNPTARARTTPRARRPRLG